MKQIPLSFLALAMVLLFQNCKKTNDDTTTTTTTPVLQATINGTAWTPDTLSATITYYAATKTKVFNFTGTYNQRRLNCVVTLSNATNINDFTIGAYTVDATGNPLMVYSTQQKDETGNYIFTPVAKAATGDGLVSVSGIDVAKGAITGSFSFNSRTFTYDSDGNIASISNTVVSSGAFTSMPYTFISQ